MTKHYHCKIINCIMPSATKSVDRVARTFRTVLADSNGKLPTRIEILKAGMWDTPNHGMFMITPDDIQEMIANFQAGIGLPGQGQIGAPIDFGHDSDALAAGWITGLATDGDTLFADVEWTTAGKDALNGGTYKCFSPEFYPGSRGGWEDPEAYGDYVPNVLVGGGLTNIPLFKGLKPIVASQNGGKVSDERNVIYISASVKEQKSMPTLEEVLAKDVTALSEEDKQVLTDNQAKLTDEQKTTFGFEVATVADTGANEADKDKNNEGEAAVTEPTAEEKEANDIQASIKSGEMTVIKASDLKELQDMKNEYRESKAKAIVASHVKRGAIKTDQLGDWTKRVMADSSVADLLKNLPDNQLLASEKGSDNALEVDEKQSQADRAAALVKASDGKLNIGDAVRQVIADDKSKEIK